MGFSEAPIGARIPSMTAKEKVLEQAPDWTEEQAAAALRAAESTSGSILVEDKRPTEPPSDSDEESDEPELETSEELESVWIPESWETFEDGTPQPDWTALIRADRDNGH
jgi:hypothetical protein